MPDRGSRSWNPREESNHRNNKPRIPNVVRRTVAKIWPGRRTKKGRRVIE